MTFSIEVDDTKLLRNIDGMLQNLKGLEHQLPQTFLEWQHEDMNRKWPFIHNQTGLSVTTLIYPRSRTWGQRNKGRGIRQVARARVRRRRGGKKPILRPELVTVLMQRMLDMLKRAVKWQ